MKIVWPRDKGGRDISISKYHDVFTLYCCQLPTVYTIESIKILYSFNRSVQNKILDFVGMSYYLKIYRYLHDVFILLRDVSILLILQYNLCLVRFLRNLL